jgi:pSer/pThr/pTyr-binding forkhead associated (FHA) protein
MSLRYCPAGRHPMDPGWEVCPYCASESAPRDDATRRSVREDESPSPPPAGPLGERTVFGDTGGDAEPARRIAGLLVTYTWRGEGEAFLVREGSNLVGTSPECEIRITADPRMSARHACIVVRPGGFWIDDEKSMNGTFVDGTLIEEKRRLPGSAVLRTGATLWRFTAIEPPPEG